MYHPSTRTKFPTTHFIFLALITLSQFRPVKCSLLGPNILHSTLTLWKLKAINSNILTYFHFWLLQNGLWKPPLNTDDSLM
jgi:hypothetical protein